MNEPSTIPLADLANEYAARWSAERPLPETMRPTNRTEPLVAPEANEAFYVHLEISPDYSRCGINE